jgi:hypothetical protein
MAEQFDNGALNEYNDNLREAVNFSRQLSENVLLLNKRMALLTPEARMTRRLVGELESELKKTITLTDKLYAGKLKEKEAQQQLTQLTNKYDKYIKDAADSTTELGKYLEKNAQDQISSQNHLNNLLQGELALKDRIRRTDLEIDLAQQTIVALEAQKVRASATRRDFIQNEINQQKDIVRQLNAEIAADERILKSKQNSIKLTQDQLDASKRIIEAHEVLVDQYGNEIQKGKELLKNLKDQKNTVEGLAQKFKDIQGILGPFIPIFNFLRKVAFDVSSQVTQLQKGLALSSDEAYQVRSEFNELATATQNVLITTNDLIASNAALGKQLGFNARFSNDAVVEFTKLTKQIGLSEEAAGGLAKFAKANGMTLKETKTVALGVSQQLSSQYGIQLDQREVLEEIGKISGQTLAMFKANPAALAQAVAQAKLLGTNLDIAKKQASALLDFESSIENELQAELITGQQFNLERARSASLMGDLTTTMKELNNQGIDFNRFSNMNVIAQDKVAAALGLSTDELSDQLLKQQYMNMSREQVVALAGEEVANRLEAVSAQDKFNAAVEKMQDLFAKIAGGPLGQLADMMAGLLDNSAALYGIMAAIAGISFVKLIASLVTTAATLASSAVAGGALAAFINPASLIIGIAALATLGAIIGSQMTNASEAAQPAGDMFSSKGKTIVSPKEGGLFSLSDNDEFAAAPGLGNMISRQQTSATVVQQDNSALLSAVNTLIAETKNTNSGLDRLNAKQAVVKVDSQSLGTAQVIGNYNLA